jgi:hypothetical protein
VSDIAAHVPPESVTGTGTGNALLPNAAASASGLAPFPQSPVAPEPIRTLQLPYERAAMLANLPRRKFSEGAAAALTGLAGSLPSGIEAFLKGYARNPFSLEAFETIQIVICVVFLVWLIVALFYSFRGRTSLQYLAELYPEVKKSDATPQQ